MTPAALESLASAAALEIGGVELKVPAGEEGRVFTIWIGEDLLLLLDGSVSERLGKAIGRQRYRFLTLADSAEGPEAELFEEVARSREMQVYKAHFVGPTGRIASLLDRGEVRAVTLDDTPNRANAYLALKERYADAKRGSVLRAMTPDPQQLGPLGREVPPSMPRDSVVIQR